MQAPHLLRQDSGAEAPKSISGGNRLRRNIVCEGYLTESLSFVDFFVVLHTIQPPGRQFARHRELGRRCPRIRGRGALDYFRPTSHLRLIELGETLERMHPVDTYEQGPHQMHIIHKGCRSLFIFLPDFISHSFSGREPSIGNIDTRAFRSCA